MTEDRLLQPAQPDQAQPATELRAFLIADVRGYTRFTVEHGDEAAARLTTKFARIARDVAAARGGEVIELRGDEALAVFSSPRQALRAGIDLQIRCLEAEREEPDLPLRAGVGIDAGEAVRVEAGYRGAALNLAARLCSLAGPREVLASEGIVHLARRTEGLAYAERGLVELKGFVEPVRVIQVLAEDVVLAQAPDVAEAAEALPRVSLPIGRFLGALPPQPIVGRQEELSRLEPILDAAEAGSGQFVVLTGEGGVGKTRLAQEVGSLVRDRGFLLATGRCFQSEHGVSLFPFLEAIDMAFTATPASLRARVARQWPQLRKLLPDREGAPVMLESEEGEDSQRLFRSVAAYLNAVAELQPVALLLDDVQWADEGSVRLLQHLARHTRDHRILLVATYTDGLLEADGYLRRTMQELTRERLVERMTVRRLDQEGTADMVGGSVGDTEAGQEFAEFVHRRTRGNPALIEEMLHALGGRYRLVRQIGLGGMGRVFQAVDSRTGRVVAAKILFASSEADLDALLRFQQEGAVLSTLKHPNIVEVYGTFLEEHTSCIIMELLEGGSLRDLLRQERPSLARLKSVAQQVASALAYAHGKGVVHRDVKPDNVMILTGDHVKVTDFGIARILRPGSTVNTMTGMTLGTPSYMAPEQIEGGLVDGRSDMYSLGAVLYEAVTGRPPFEGDDPITVAFRQVHDPPQPPRELRADVPPDWEELILKALAKDPTERHASATALERAIGTLSTIPAEGAHQSVGTIQDVEPAPRILRPTAPTPVSAGPLAVTAVPAEPARVRESRPAAMAGLRRAIVPRLRPLKLLRVSLPLAVAALAVVAVAHSVTSGSSATVLGQPVSGWSVHTNTLPLSFPDGVAVDSAGIVYVADRLNNRIARLAADGTPLAAWGAEGSGNGQFQHPGSVSIDRQGYIYVADSGNDRIQKLAPDGTFLTSFGSSGSGDGQLRAPGDIAVDRQGDIYVADSGNNRLQELSASGKYLRQWPVAAAYVTISPTGTVYASDATNNRVDQLIHGKFTPAFGSPGIGPGNFSGPQGIAVDRQGNVFAADSRNNRIEEFNQAGRYVRSTALNVLSSPHGLSLDAVGNLYVADAGNNVVKRLSADTQTVAAWTDLPGTGGLLDGPNGIAIDTNGNLFVADTNHNRIAKVSPDGVLLAAWGTRGTRRGRFRAPQAVTVGAGGNIYVADTLNYRIQELSPSGLWLGEWGHQGTGSDQFSDPSGIAASSSGEVYVADASNNRIQEFSAKGRFIRSWGHAGPADGDFESPYGVAVDSRGNVYVADQDGNRVEVFTSSGRFLYARGSTSSGSGGSSPGEFSNPDGVAVDAHASLYVADSNNNRVQELSPAGKVLAVVDRIGPGNRFFDPTGIEIDAGGDAFVVDSGHNRIVKIAPR